MEGEELNKELLHGELCILVQLYPRNIKRNLQQEPYKPYWNSRKTYFKNLNHYILSRAHDHEIPPLDGFLPEHRWPYRYSHMQKEEIEKIVDELLHAQVRRPSSSPVGDQDLRDCISCFWELLARFRIPVKLKWAKCLELRIFSSPHRSEE